MDKIHNPDPSAIGLFGLAMVTLVASTQKLGITSGYALEIPWAIFLGSFAQIVAGLYDFKKNNVFGATAFLAFGLFWLAVAFTWGATMGIFGETMMAGSDSHQFAFGFLGYFIFSMYMTIGATATNKVLFSIFVLIDVLMLMLVIYTFGFWHEAGFIAGLAELGIAILSFYLSAANVLNIQFNRTFLPVGKPFGNLKKIA